MSEQIFGLVGENLEHSFSAEIHPQLGDYNYQLFPMSKNELERFLKTRPFTGINITIPYKQTVMPFIETIDDTALTIGAVNTIINREDRLYGYNTDFNGMLDLAANHGISMQDKKVLILGTGGTSKTAHEVALQSDAIEVYCLSREPNMDREELRNIITYEEAYENHSDAEIIINTTPIGMYPKTMDKSPIDISKFPYLTGVIDVIYNPLRTKLVLEATKRGIPACSGLYMLVMQAYHAAKLFTEQEIDLQKAEAIFAELQSSKQNIVLTGMPSSGKTTIGKILAKNMDRIFIDTDDMIVAREGKEISQIFEEVGEEGFRKIEAEVIRSLESTTGAIIATGGGAILHQENIDSLKANGLIYFLDRPIEQLKSSDNRPLLKDDAMIQKRYDERIELYLSTSDSIIPIDKDAEEIALEIERIHSCTF